MVTSINFAARARRPLRVLASLIVPVSHTFRFRRRLIAILAAGLLAFFAGRGAPHLFAQEASAAAYAPDARVGAILTHLEQARGIAQTALSPDGRLIAWVADQQDGSEIDVASTADPAHFRQITAGSSSVCVEQNLAWSPDSRRLAFTSDCDQNGQPDIYTAGFSTASPAAASAPRRLTHLTGAVDALSFSPSGRQIGFLYTEGATRHPGALDAMKPPSGVIGIASAEIQRVAAVTLSSGQTRELTPGDLHVYEFDWSPDGERLAYIAAAPPGEDNWWVAKLYTQDLPSGPAAPAPSCETVAVCPTLHVLFDPVASPGRLHGLQIAVPRWSPDGSSIAFIGGLMSDQGITGGDIYLLSSSGGRPKDLTAHSGRTAVWLHWRRVGASGLMAGTASASPPTLLVSWIKAGHAVIGALDASTGGTVTYATLPASIGDGRLSMGLSVAAGGRLAYIRSSFHQAPEVYLGRLGASAQPVTHYNDKVRPDWGKAESIQWKSDGFSIQGWLLYPARYDPSKKYPLIVGVHGGPSGAILPQWPFPGYNPIAFSALGYFVLLPNPRGSFGEGEDFTAANRRDFGYGDLRDILAGVDAAIARLPIDPQRVGITGWSYGGFMTMFAITQTTRFRAAVAGAGISDWQSYYGENSIDQWMLPFFGASVYDDPAAYARSSPIAFIRHAKTPTLLAVGDRDGECPAPQSFEFWHGLRAEHVPTELVVYPDEGHHFVSFAHRRDVMERALSWFERYMPPDESGD
jgi:dipeptidyl aminopeptidase/acylaminoacyl peptidase